MTYYNKRTPVEAAPYAPGMEDGFAPHTYPVGYDGPPLSDVPYLNTKQGRQLVNYGDYIITNPDGERYPCSKETFESTYVEVIAYEMDGDVVPGAPLNTDDTHPAFNETRQRQGLHPTPDPSDVSASNTDIPDDVDTEEVEGNDQNGDTLSDAGTADVQTGTTNAGAITAEQSTQGVGADV